MSYLNEFFSQIQSHFGLLVTTTILGVTAFFFSGRWLVTMFTVLGVGIAFLFLWYLPYSWYPAEDFLSTEVPWPIYPYFWQSLFLWAIALGMGVWLLAQLIRRSRRRRGLLGVEPGRQGEASELETAWSEIVRALAEAGVDLARLRVSLLMAPTPGWGPTLLEAGGASVRTSAPGTPGPLHADLTPHGLVIDITGVTCFGTRNIATLAQLEAFCRMLRAQRPECPLVRSVAIVLPADWLQADPEAAARTAMAARDDLNTIQRVFLARFPIFVLVAGMQDVPGFNEYALRTPAGERSKRRGFSDPSRPYSASLVKAGLAYMSQSFYERVVEAIQGDLLDQPGNARLFRFLDAYQELRRTLRTVLEALLAIPGLSEPLLLHGCYFLGTGTRDEERAFAAGLVRDPEGGIFAERRPARWSEEAWEADRVYQRLALTLAVATALVAGWFWLRQLRQPGTSAWWSVVVGALVVAWVVALVSLGTWARRLRADME